MGVLTTGDMGDDGSRSDEPFPGPCRREIDIGADAAVEIIQTAQFDAEGRVVRFEQDEDLDGRAESVTTMSYDEEGRLIRWESDDPAGGELERRIAYEYGDDGRLARVLRHSRGQLDNLETYTWDGNTATVEVTREGVQEPVGQRTEVYDENGNLTRSESDFGSNGEVDQSR